VEGVVHPRRYAPVRLEGEAVIAASRNHDHADWAAAGTSAGGSGRSPRPRPAGTGAARPARPAAGQLRKDTGSQRGSCTTRAKRTSAAARRTDAAGAKSNIDPAPPSARSGHRPRATRSGPSIAPRRRRKHPDKSPIGELRPQTYECGLPTVTARQSDGTAIRRCRRVRGLGDHVALSLDRPIGTRHSSPDGLPWPNVSDPPPAPRRPLSARTHRCCLRPLASCCSLVTPLLASPELTGEPTPCLLDSRRHSDRIIWPFWLGPPQRPMSSAAHQTSSHHRGNIGNKATGKVTTSITTYAAGGPYRLIDGRLIARRGRSMIRLARDHDGQDGRPRRAVRRKAESQPGGRRHEVSGMTPDRTSWNCRIAP